MRSSVTIQSVLDETWHTFWHAWAWKRGRLLSGNIGKELYLRWGSWIAGIKTKICPSRRFDHPSLIAMKRSHVFILRTEAAKNRPMSPVRSAEILFRRVWNPPLYHASRAFGHITPWCPTWKNPHLTDELRGHTYSATARATAVRATTSLDVVVLAHFLTDQREPNGKKNPKESHIYSEAIIFVHHTIKYDFK